MKSVQQEVDERSNLTNSNKFELLLFRLGGDANGEHSELFGINVFKIREIVAMPEVTAVAGSPPHMLGVVNLRGQIITVLDLPGIVGVTPKTGLNIMLVTEFARTTQAFAVESVDEIVRLDWSQVLTAEGTAGGKVTSIARVDGDVQNTRLAQVLDVETILRELVPPERDDIDPETIGPKVLLKAGAVILAADDSVVARNLIEKGLEAMGVHFIMTGQGSVGAAAAHFRRRQGRRRADQRPCGHGADRLGNAGDGRLHADPPDQAGCTLQQDPGGDSLFAVGQDQRRPRQGRGRRCVCGQVLGRGPGRHHPHRAGQRRRVIAGHKHDGRKARQREQG